MDLQARRVSGADGLTFLLLATRFHMLLGTVLRRLLPSRFKGPAYASIGTSMPYSKVCLLLPTCVLKGLWFNIGFRLPLFVSQLPWLLHPARGGAGLPGPWLQWLYISLDSHTSLTFPRQGLHAGKDRASWPSRQQTSVLQT